MVYHSSVRATTVAAALSAVGAGAGKAAMTITDNGRPAATIVVSPDAIGPEKTAANELADWLEKVTSARLRIADQSDDAASVYVGRSPRVDALLAGVDWAALGQDGIVIRTVGGDVLLAGGRPRGTLMAVYTFLQDTVGCRWWAPDAQAIPSRPTLRIDDLDVVYRPPFDLRQTYTQAAADPLFAVRLRQNGRAFSAPIPDAYGGSVDFGGAHTLLRRFLPPAEFFEKHPGWYAFRQDTGKRAPSQLCMTNPDVQKRVAEAVLALVAREHPRIVSVSPADSNQACQCDACAAVRQREGSESGVLLELVNSVAEKVERVYPDVLISTLAYWHTDRPPTHIKPRRNVLIHFGVLDRNHKHPIPEVANFSRYLRTWNRIASHVYMWDYDANFHHFMQPHPNHRVVAKSLRFYKGQGVRGVFLQGNWGPCAEFMQMRAYVTSQLMWDPDQDDKALMGEFLNGYYGAAGPCLLRYLEAIDHAIHRQADLWLGAYSTTTRSWFTLEDLNAATRLFDQAAEAVAGDDTVLERVRRARVSIDLVWIERYRELRRTAQREGSEFLGPEDPYAEAERIARNEFGINTHRESRGFGEYIGMLRKLWPPRSGRVPLLCERLPSYAWEDVQEDLLRRKSAEPGDAIVEDPEASDGKAMRLAGREAALEAQFELPDHLAGRWRVHVVLRAEPGGADAGAVALGVYARDRPDGAVQEVARHVAACPAAQADGYRTFDLGTHELAAGSTIWVQPNGAGSYGQIEATCIDRMFLISVP